MVVLRGRTAKVESRNSKTESKTKKRISARSLRAATRRTGRGKKHEFKRSWCRVILCAEPGGRSGGTSRRLHLISQLLRKFEDHGDPRHDFYGLAIERGGYVCPLADRVQSCFNQKGVARENLQLFDGTVRGDDNL